LKRARFKTGSVVFDKARGTWRLLQWIDGKRRSQTIGTKQRYPTKAAAQQAAEALKACAAESAAHPIRSVQPAVKTLVEQYRAEKMPERFSTRRGYNSWLNNHVLPRWGQHSIGEVQARPVELWLQSLSLAPRSKTGIRMMLNLLWEYAMWHGDVPVQRNPMELVSIKNASKRTGHARSLTVEEFQKLLAELQEPFHTVALVSVCFGLRISECLALKWSDVDWLNAKLYIRRSIVRQHVGDTKTEYSNRPLAIDAEMLEVLKLWKQTTQFSTDDDWVFASPVLLGRLPWSADAVNDAYLKAVKSAQIAPVSTHSMRHTYRSWLDAVGTAIAVQQKLMRHADIRTTMNVYGDVVTDEMAQAASKVAGLALNGSQADRKPS
jgi:integrase